MEKFKRLVQAFFAAADGAFEDVIAENIREDAELLKVAESVREYAPEKSQANGHTEAEPA